MGESPPGFIMKSIYFNHIPRTGGTTLSRMLHNSGINKCGLNIFNSETSFYQNKNFNEENVLASDIVMGHYGMAPEMFNSDIDTITFLRNPVDQVVSMFCKLNHESQNLNNEAAIFDVFRLSKFKDDSVELFREWLFDKRSNEYTHNGQIYNLINTRYPYLYDPVTKKVTGTETRVLVTPENAKEKIDSLLFLGSTENIYEGYIKVIDTINNRFKTDLKKLQKAGIYNGASETKTILMTLSKVEIDYILSKSPIDNHYWQMSQRKP